MFGIARSRFSLFSSGNDSPSKEDSVSAPEADLLPVQKKGGRRMYGRTRCEQQRIENEDRQVLQRIRMQPLDDVKDKEFESDFEELYETDEEIDDLYSARDIVMKKMVKDEYFNMDDKKWDELVEDGIKHGILKDTKECEQILEDMLSWDKLLPDDMKKKVEAKFNELGDLCEKGELEPEEACNQFKEFEDQMVMEYGKMMEAEGPPKFDETDVADNKKDLDDPPGEGPILRWQTRVVFEPGNWLASVIILGKMSLPSLVRGLNTEENRKDCLGTLFSLIEEAGKANKLVEDARTSYVKERLRANPQSMERLRAKKMGLQPSYP
ncbi:hypothetical protein SDJN03_16228, partial [Cucurbita argyrosperma subsp. sororia]